MDRLIGLLVYVTFVVTFALTMLTGASWFELMVGAGIVSIHLLILDVNGG